MKVYAYWNTNNNDCKKIFHFFSKDDKYSIISAFERENEIFVERIFMNFSDSSKIMEGIRNAEVVIFCTHGTPDEILKYQNSVDRPLGEYILIDQNNMDVLENKIVLAFCCASAKVLGEKCVNNPHRCKAYVGFKSDIVYDNGRAKKSRHLIYESYKKAFQKSLEYALNTKCTVGQFKVALLQNMRKESVRAIIESQNHSLHNMYAGTINGLVALGDETEVLFA